MHLRRRVLALASIEQTLEAEVEQTANVAPDSPVESLSGKAVQRIEQAGQQTGRRWMDEQKGSENFVFNVRADHRKRFLVDLLYAAKEEFPRVLVFSKTENVRQLVAALGEVTEDIRQQSNKDFRLQLKMVSRSSQGEVLFRISATVGERERAERQSRFSFKRDTDIPWLRRWMISTVFREGGFILTCSGGPVLDQVLRVLAEAGSSVRKAGADFYLVVERFEVIRDEERTSAMYRFHVHKCDLEQEKKDNREGPPKDHE